MCQRGPRAWLVTFRRIVAIVIKCLLDFTMGVAFVEAPGLPTLHAYRASRRRGAIAKKKTFVEQMQSEIMQLRLKAAWAERELRRWETWWQEQGVGVDLVPEVVKSLVEAVPVLDRATPL